MLKATSLVFSYPGSVPMHFPDIHCPAGAHWLILGASGSGKTTLLQLLAGLRTPQQGEVQIGDTIITKLSAAALDTFRGQHIGVVFQQSHFIHSLNVEENVSIARHLAGKSPDRDRVRGLLERLGLGHKLSSATHRLSHGEQQRVAIARALVNEPAVILADEPTSALDDDNTAQVIALLEDEASRAHATLIVVTHDGRLKNQFKNQIIL